MAEQSDNSPNEAGATANGAASLADAAERLELLKAIQRLQQENKIMAGKLLSGSPQVLEELQAKNKELKDAIDKIEHDLLGELLNRKKTLEISSVSDKLQVLKTAVICYCKERNIDPSLWKSLESL